MTAWQILTAGSTLPNGTAWDHLNAQGVGSGGPVTLNLYGTTEVVLEPDLSVALTDEFYVVEIEDD